jgi:hypothetical protein
MEVNPPRWGLHPHSLFAIDEVRPLTTAVLTRVRDTGCRGTISPESVALVVGVLSLPPHPRQ